MTDKLLTATSIWVLLLLMPVLAGLLLVWVSRKDRRRKFIQNRLRMLAARNNEEPSGSGLSLEKLQRAASLGLSASLLVPQILRVRLAAACEATGNRVGLLHLLVTGSLAAIVVVVFSSRVLGLNPTLAMLLAATAAGLALLGLLRAAQSRYQKKFLDTFPDALDLVGRAIKAGLPVTEALVVAGQEIPDPVGSEFRRALDQVQIGVSIIDALEKTADRVRVADFRFMIVALALQQKAGGSLAETLANLSKVIRARKAIRLKARGLTAEAKMSAMVLAALPFLVGGMLSLMNRDLMHALFFDPRGRFMIGVALVSLLTGLATMYMMIKRALR